MLVLRLNPSAPGYIIVVFVEEGGDGPTVAPVFHDIAEDFSERGHARAAQPRICMVPKPHIWKVKQRS